MSNTPLSCAMRVTGLGLVTPNRRLTNCILTVTSRRRGIGIYNRRTPPPCPRHYICTVGTTSPVCPSTSRTDAWRTLGLKKSRIGFTLDRGWRSTLGGRVLFGNELCNAMWLTFRMRKRLGNSSIVSAGPFFGTAQGRTASLPDILIATVHLHRHVPGGGGTCGVSTFKLVDMRCIRTTRTYACE